MRHLLELEAAHRELQIRELRCSRELQSALHHGGSRGIDLRMLHEQSIRLTQRLSAMEEEWTALRSSEACVRAVEARQRVDELSGRCADLRAQLAIDDRPVAAELTALAAEVQGMADASAAEDDHESAERAREEASLGAVGELVTALEAQLAALLRERELRLAAQVQEAADGKHAQRTAARALQAELDALHPELDIAKVELGRLQQSSSTADGSEAQQKEQLRQLEQQAARL